MPEKTYPECLVDTLIEEGYDTLSLEYNIENGDITPEESMELERIKKRLAEFFTRYVLKNRKNKI